MTQISPRELVRKEHRKNIHTKENYNKTLDIFYMRVVGTETKYKIKIPKYVKKTSYYLGIAEKPTAAKRIANILDTKAKKISIKVSRKNGKEDNLPSTTAYFVKTDKIKLVIIPALGHLFTLIQDGVGWQYPVYDFKWVPNHLSSKVNKAPSKFDLRTESAVESIRYLAENTDEYIVMTDYDEEGEVIGGILLSQLAGEKSLNSAKRMKFSSFAEKEIKSSLEDALGGTQINFGMYNRGLMRHYLDWLWGINLSRALMLSLKNTSGQYLTLSTGRVQGPTLSFISKRQHEIESYVPVPYFRINLTIKADNLLDLEYDHGLIPAKTEAELVITQTKDAMAEVTEIRSKIRTKNPPTPFNLSKLQNDAYRYHRLSPSRTLRAAENLYLDAAISYPRTSSEKYPPDMDHSEILDKIENQNKYSKYVEIVRDLDNLDPKQGKKTDPAHPCIYPTGTKPKKMKGDEAKIYNLVIHRYLATFGTPSKSEYNRVNFDINGNEFHLSGKRVVKQGWRRLAGRYGKLKENELPDFSKGDTFPVSDSAFVETYSRSPPYYNQSSLLKKMESEGIGTKATRSEIIKSLFDRKYLKGDPIEITPVGEIVNQVLQKYSSQVVSVELSRRLEKMGDLVEDTLNSENPVKTFTLADAIVQGVIYLHDMLDDLQENEEKVGALISRELRSQRKKARELGTCQTCNKGQLKIIQSQKSGKRFVGCTEYFNDKNCTVTYPLPQKGRLEPLDKPCKADGYPRIKVFSGKRPWILCLNPECPIREEYLKKQEKKKAKKKSKKESAQKEDK